jgi:hypothetical protein
LAPSEATEARIAILKRMSIRFDKFSASVPSGSWIGLIGSADDVLNQATHRCENLSAMALPERLRWLSEAEKVRRGGGVVMAHSADPELLRNLADEVWWIEAGQLVQRGAASEVIDAYLRKVYSSLPELAPSLKRGDGRAEIVSIEILDGSGQETALIHSGQPAAIRVTVRYHAAVADPVVGIMIRTRIGFEVYGTNTELEQLKLGPVESGQTRTITFRFDCQLCPQSYTITAASHDPDGVWHEWMEDAMSFTVADTRYTAGVANLRARAELS